MDKLHYEELKENIYRYREEGLFDDNSVYLFGHCEASLTKADELFEIGIRPKAILDNSSSKAGIEYKGIKVAAPDLIVGKTAEKSVVLIAIRFYESMKAQLIELGYKGQILKVVDYNTYSEYSLSKKTISEKRKSRQGPVNAQAV